MKTKVFNFGLLFIFAAGLCVAAKAQEKSCGLSFEIYAYEAKSPKNRIKNAQLVIKNLKTKETRSLNFSPTANSFEKLADGKYRIEITGQGYEKKTKDINLACEFADQDNIVRQNLYLWQDKTASEEDLVEDSKASTVEQKASQTVQPKSDGEKEFGKVTLEIMIDEDGNVIAAKALDGKSSLAEKSVKAARQSKFAPTVISGIPVKVTGKIVYNFVP